jgi:PAS domain S-box-containing protein
VDRDRLAAQAFAGEVQALIEIPFCSAPASLGVSTVAPSGFGPDARETLIEFAGVLAVALDRLRHLAVQEEAAARLRQQSEETERFFASALDLLCITDSAGRFVRLNSEWHRFLGYQPAALQGQLLFDFVHPDDREPAEAAVATLRRGGTVVDFVTRWRAVDGSYHPIEWRAAATGEVIYATAREISARVREEEETRVDLALQQVRNAVLGMRTPADWPGVVATVQRLLRPLIAFRDCEVDLVEREGAEIREVAVTSSGRYQATNPKPAVRAALASGQTVYRPDRRHPLFSPLMKPEVHSVLDIPFNDGTLALNSTRERAFSERDIHVAQRFAAVLAEGHRRLRDLMAREQAEREIRANEARLQSLVAILQYPAQSLQDLLDHALEEALRLTSSRLGYIYHYDEATREFILHSWSRSAMAACAITQPQTRYQLDRTGLWGEAVRQRRPIVANDFAAPDPLKKGYPAGHAPLSRFMTVPVWAGDQIAAVVGVANKDENYTDSDVLQLTLLMESVFGIVSRMRTEALVRLQAATMDNMAEGVCLVGFSDGIIRYANARYGQLCGYEPDELVGNGAIATLAATDHTPVETLEEIMAALRHQGEWHGEVLALRRNGTTCWCYTNASRLDHPEHGQVAVIVYSDITGRKEAEQALRQSEAALRRAQQVSRIGSWVWHIDSDRLECSDEMLRIAGVSVSDVRAGLNRRVQRRLHRDDRQRLRAARRAILAGTVPPSFELRLVRPDQTVRVVSIEAGEITLDDQGQPGAVTGIAQDITERRALEAQIEQQRLRAQQADRLQALGEMATGVAHELNQPLNGIRAFAEGLLIARQRGWTVSAEAQAETLQDIVDQVDRMTAIIDHMRVFARDPSRQRAQSFTLAEPVAGAMRLMGAQLRVHGIQVDQDVDDDLPTCSGWPHAVEQIVLNLLSNARDALDARRQRQKAHAADTPPDWRPSLSITAVATPDQRHAQLAVTDNGGGIPAGIMERIFEPFFTTKEPGQGTGLGLAIALGIAERHGGRIQVDNRPGDGVTLTLVLPAMATGDGAAGHRQR